jgi:hypothetical protein
MDSPNLYGYNKRWIRNNKAVTDLYVIASHMYAVRGMLLANFRNPFVALHNNNQIICRVYRSHLPWDPSITTFPSTVFMFDTLHNQTEKFVKPEIPCIGQLDKLTFLTFTDIYPAALLLYWSVHNFILQLESLPSSNGMQRLLLRSVPVDKSISLA